MKPDKEGIWEWFEEDGTKRLMYVCNVGGPLPEHYLRVYWWGGYYNISDDPGVDDKYGPIPGKAEWPDRWGNYIGPLGTVPDADLYLGPTPEQREEIIKKYKNS